MTTAIQKSDPGALVVHRDVSPPLEFTPQQQQMIRDTYANGADTKEFQVLMEIAKVRRLNPLLRQVHFVKRWDSQKSKDVWAVQCGIDGFRAIAERTGKYDGQDEPEYTRDKDGLILSCKVKVYRKDWSRPAVGIAHWSEYVQTKKDGTPTRFWKTMPHVMLAKCAEAVAMRKAFPEDMSGLYTEEEMMQADNDRPETGTNGQTFSPHTAPGESLSEPAKQSSKYDAVLKALLAIDEVIACKASVTYQDVLTMREQIGSRTKPSELGKQISALVNGDDVAPAQRQEMGRLWNRLDRQITKLEGTIQAPAVEASFEEEDEL